MVPAFARSPARRRRAGLETDRLLMPRGRRSARRVEAVPDDQHGVITKSGANKIPACSRRETGKDGWKPGLNELSIPRPPRVRQRSS